MSPDRFTSQLVAEVNTKLAQRPLVFLTREAERFLGLEDLLENYYGAFVVKDFIAANLQERGLGCVFTESESTSKIVSSREFHDYLVAKQAGNCDADFGFLQDNSSLRWWVQFFKNSGSGIDALETADIDAKLLNNSSKLTRQLENKVVQYQLLADSPLSRYLPESQVTKLSEIEHDKIRDRYYNYVVQLPFGHTGSSTFLITEDENGSQARAELDQLTAQYPQRACRVVELVSGRSFTLNGCVSRGKVWLGGLSYQFTGVSGLTDNSASTVGNDWELPAKILTEEQISEVVSLGEQIGSWLRDEQNFRGLFGIDFVVDRKTGQLSLIEINPRQVASTPMHTKLQLKQSQLPLALLNLAEFLEIELPAGLEPDSYNHEAVRSLPGSQVFLRLPRGKSQITTLKVKSGVYRQQSDNAARELISLGRGDEVFFLDEERDRPLIFNKLAISVAEFDQDGFLLSLAPNRTNLKPGAEVARIQANYGLANLDGEGNPQLTPLVHDTLRRVREIAL